MSWSMVGLAASTFLASAVEFVEAFTIVLAMGADPRLALGAVRASSPRWSALAVVTAVVGYALQSLAARVATAARRRHAAPDLRSAVAAQGDPPLAGPEGAARRGGDVPRGGRGRAAPRGERSAPRPRLVRLRRLLQGRVPRGPRGRLHRHHVRAERGLDPARRSPGPRRRRARGRRRRSRAPAARAGAREHDQVRRRPAADRRSARSGPSRVSARSPPTSQPRAGRAATSHCSWCSPPGRVRAARRPAARRTAAPRAHGRGGA